MKPLTALFIVCVIDVLGFGVLIPLVPYMGHRFGASPAVITVILGTYSLCQLLAAPLWGRLSDRFGRRPILLSSMAGACLSYLLLGFASSIAGLFAARALAGFMAGNISAAMAYAADISTPAGRARALGSVGAAIGLGFMLGPAIGGALAGERIEAANFLTPALFSAALSLLAMLLVVLVLRESHTPARRAAERSAGTRQSAWQVLRARPALRWLSLGALLVTFSQSTLDSIFAIWAMNRYHVGPRTIGFSIFGIAIIAVAVQGGLVRVLVPRYGEYRVALSGIAGYVIGLCTVAFASSLPLVIAGLMLCGWGAGAYNPCGSALASHQARSGNRGTVMGTYQASNSLARVLAPFLSGTVYSRLGSSAPFVLAALVTLQAVWCLLGARRTSAVLYAGDMP